MSNTQEDQAPVLQSFDEQWAKKYRDGDSEALSTGGVLHHYGAILQGLSASFGYTIDALDVGCGTGRYFHCLRSVKRLVGTDLSSHMLEQARRPIHADSIPTDRIELICGDLAALSLPDSSFDLIYSIGVYGEYSPLDGLLIGHFKRLLRPGGKFFVTAVDATSRISVPENTQASLTRRVLRKAWPVLPSFMKVGVNRRLSPFYVTYRGLVNTLDSAGLGGYEIQSFAHTAGWLGTHFDNFGRK